MANSSFKIVKQSFERAYSHFWDLVVQISFSLLIVISAFVPLWLFYRDSFGADSIPTRLFEITMNFSIYVLVLFLSAVSLFNKTFKPAQPLKIWPFTLKITWPLLYESLRALFIIVGYSFLLIIPGVVKAVRYFLVTYIVFFNQNYHAGKLDALKHSHHLSQGYGWWIFLLFIVSPSLLSALPGVLIEEFLNMPLYQWLKYLFIVFFVYIGALISLYFVMVLFFLYCAKDKEHLPEAKECV